MGMAIGAGAKVATMATEERGFSQAVDDTAIALAINAKFGQAGPAVYRNVYTTVREGKVLLTGEVAKPADRIEAVRLTWTVKGVRAVVNDLTMPTGQDGVDLARDVWLANRMDTDLLLDSEIQAVNYTVDVVGDTLHIMGIAQDARERDRVLAYARALPHIRKIADHTRLKADPSP
ncbi:transport-associated protein [Rhodospirillum rubrum F11]|nr:transport-associated protein [Rhodospirillum rubrum F11]